jgi:hypothetical protein
LVFLHVVAVVLVAAVVQVVVLVRCDGVCEACASDLQEQAARAATNLYTHTHSRKHTLLLLIKENTKRSKKEAVAAAVVLLFSKVLNSPTRRVFSVHRELNDQVV